MTGEEAMADADEDDKLWEIQSKGMNYLLIAHGAGLVASLTVFSDRRHHRGDREVREPLASVLIGQSEIFTCCSDYFDGGFPAALSLASNVAFFALAFSGPT
jgi:hypothetical protein